MRWGEARRPGLGSAVVRLLAIANAAFWLLGIPELVDVWGKADGYTIPGSFALPRATIWIVAVMLIASAVMVCAGWWSRRHTGMAAPLRRFALVLGALQTAWAVLLTWSFIVDQIQISQQTMPAGAGQFLGLLLAVFSALSAVALFRDARFGAIGVPAAPLSGLPPKPRGPARLVTSAVVRLLLAGVFALLIVRLADVLRAWDAENANNAESIIPWGPVLLGCVCAASAVLLVVGWWHRPRPRAVVVALRVAAALQATWVVLIIWSWIVEPVDLSRQINPVRDEAFAALAFAIIAGVTARIHDRDARAIQSVRLASGAGGEQPADGVEAGAAVV